MVVTRTALKRSIESVKGRSATSPSNSSKKMTDVSVHHQLEGTLTNMFEEAGITNTMTKGGWCLREGMTHILKIDKEKCLEGDCYSPLIRIVKNKGLPAIYSIVEDACCRHQSSTINDSKKATTTSITPNAKPQNCFQSLCRIIAGQQLAGAAARAMWHRLLKVTSESVKECTKMTTTSKVNHHSFFTPTAILALSKKGMETYLQKPAGLSRAKARAIVALAEAFTDRDNKRVNEAFLTSPDSTEDAIREALLPIKGIGPWTCDIFLMFYLEKENVLPVGDLGVRKGIAKYFGLKGKGYKGSLCQVKDKKAMEEVMAPYKPYQSLMTYYMWTVADTADFYRDTKSSTAVTNKPGNTIKKAKR